MNTLERFTRIIKCLATDRNPLNLSEIGKKVGLSKGTVSRMLSSLEALQWVVRDPETRRYSLGECASQLGISILPRFDIRSISLPFLFQLRDVTQETSLLSLRVGSERVYLEQAQSTNEIRHVPEMGKLLPLWCGSVGKAILAHIDENERERILNDFNKSGLKIFADGGVLNVDMLRKELAEIRKSGFAVSSGERVATTVSVSAPIFIYNHQIFGCLSIAGASFRFTLDMARQYGPLVKEYAREISVQLGDCYSTALCRIGQENPELQ